MNFSKSSVASLSSSNSNDYSGEFRLDFLLAQSQRLNATIFSNSSFEPADDDNRTMHLIDTMNLSDGEFLDNVGEKFASSGNMNENGEFILKTNGSNLLSRASIFTVKPHAEDCMNLKVESYFKKYFFLTEIIIF